MDNLFFKNKKFRIYIDPYIIFYGKRLKGSKAEKNQKNVKFDIKNRKGIEFFKRFNDNIVKIKYVDKKSLKGKRRNPFDIVSDTYYIPKDDNTVSELVVPRLFSPLEFLLNIVVSKKNKTKELSDSIKESVFLFNSVGSKFRYITKNNYIFIDTLFRYRLMWLHDSLYDLILKKTGIVISQDKLLLLKRLTRADMEDFVEKLEENTYHVHDVGSNAMFMDLTVNIFDKALCRLEEGISYDYLVNLLFIDVAIFSAKYGKALGIERTAFVELLKLFLDRYPC